MSCGGDDLKDALTNKELRQASYPACDEGIIAQLSYAWNLNWQLTQQLTAVQKRCAELLEENRALRATRTPEEIAKLVREELRKINDMSGHHEDK